MPNWYPVIRPGDRSYIFDLPERIRHLFKSMPRSLRADYPVGYPNGGIQLYSFYDRGTGYVIGNTLTASGGNTNAIARVVSIDTGDGSVVGLQFINPGTGYSIGITTMTGGVGSGLQLLVSEVA